jgi:hypothetical protein
MIRSNTFGAQEIFDHEKMQNNDVYKGFFDADEKILFSGVLKKINKFGGQQDRILVITNKGLSNISPINNIFKKVVYGKIAPNLSLKRKIPVNSLKCMTLSTNAKSDQLVINCQGEYDYRYHTGKYRTEIIRILLRVYASNTNNKMDVFLKDDIDLWQYCTTDDDYKASISRHPKQDKVVMTEQEFQAMGWDSLIQNRVQLISLNASQQVQNSNSISQIRPDGVIVNANSQNNMQNGGYLQPLAQQQQPNIPGYQSNNNPMAQIGTYSAPSPMEENKAGPYPMTDSDIMRAQHMGKTEITSQDYFSPQVNDQYDDLNISMVNTQNSKITIDFLSSEPKQVTTNTSKVTIDFLAPQNTNPSVNNQVQNSTTSTINQPNFSQNNNNMPNQSQLQPQYQPQAQSQLQSQPQNYNYNGGMPMNPNMPQQSMMKQGSGYMGPSNNMMPQQSMMVKQGSTGFSGAPNTIPQQSMMVNNGYARKNTGGYSAPNTMPMMSTMPMAQNNQYVQLPNNNPVMTSNFGTDSMKNGILPGQGVYETSPAQSPYSSTYSVSSQYSNSYYNKPMMN